MGEGAVSTAYIMQSFHKFIVSLFCPIPPPIRTALCKLFVEALVISQRRLDLLPKVVYIRVFLNPAPPPTAKEN